MENVMQHQQLDYKIVEREALDIMGIMVKTNHDPVKTAKEMGQLWGRFMSQGISSKIQPKAGEEIYGLYSDYEGDWQQPYEATVGFAVTKEAKPEGDLVIKQIPAARYAVFTVQGKIPEIIASAWQSIYRMGLKRTYTGDFEVYGEKAKNMENAEVNIFIAIQ